MPILRTVSLHSKKVHVGKVYYMYVVRVILSQKIFVNEEEIKIDAPRCLLFHGDTIAILVKNIRSRLQSSITNGAKITKCWLRVSMGLTVNSQTVKKVTVNRQKWKIKRQPSTVNRQLIQAKLAVKGLEYLLSRTIIASNNGLKWTISLCFPK